MEVSLSVYDVTNTASDNTNTTIVRLNNATRGLGFGVFHGAVALNGVEWSFGYCEDGTGVYCCYAGKNSLYTFRESLPLGQTSKSKGEIRAILDRLKREWPGYSYDLLARNCCHFCEVLSQELGVPPPPGVGRRGFRARQAAMLPRARACVGRGAGGCTMVPDSRYTYPALEAWGQITRKAPCCCRHVRVRVHAHTMYAQMHGCPTTVSCRPPPPAAWLNRLAQGADATVKFTNEASAMVWPCVVLRGAARSNRVQLRPPSTPPPKFQSRALSLASCPTGRRCCTSLSACRMPQAKRVSTNISVTATQSATWLREQYTRLLTAPADGSEASGDGTPTHSPAGSHQTEQGAQVESAAGMASLANRLRMLRPANAATATQPSGSGSSGSPAETGLMPSLNALRQYISADGTKQFLFGLVRTRQVGFLFGWRYQFVSYQREAGITGIKYCNSQHAPKVFSVAYLHGTHKSPAGHQPCQDLGGFARAAPRYLGPSPSPTPPHAWTPNPAPPPPLPRPPACARCV